MQRATASETPAYPWLKSYPADVDWGAEIPVKPMHLLLEEAAARFAGRICIDFLDRRYSFAEIGRRLACPRPLHRVPSLPFTSGDCPGAVTLRAKHRRSDGELRLGQVSSYGPASCPPALPWMIHR